ncbi:MAG TPA: hypothetical protein VHN15_10025 [Thermoanaerobaculia bacterium]|nr:hypothetical protein [Thermoanaerobaculia bacterium]
MTDWIRLPAAPGRARPVAWVLALLLGLAVPLSAHSPHQGQEEGGEAVDAAEEDAEPKISFHAFFNQAYAMSDGHQVFGIPERGTTDYRNVALQVRYQITSRDIVVTQLSHERLGRSTLNEVRDDVELDWAFYERRLTDDTSVKVGKMQLPVGLYNEIRDVGTLLPLYAPPLNFYVENYASESVEGVMLSRRFAPDSDWSLDADLYYGGWDRVEQDPPTGRVVEARVENGVGTQLWLNTPVPDLRFGLSAIRFDVEGRLNQAQETDTFELYALSAAARFGRVSLHTEGLWSQAPFRLTPEIVLPHIVYLAYYGQIGLELTPKWSLNWQSDFAEVQFQSGLPSVDLNEDHALGVSYRFRYNVVAKAEVHQNKGFMAENELTFIPLKTRYGILSWSVSF